MKLPKSLRFGIIGLFFSIFLAFSITHSFFVSPATSQSTEKAQAVLDLVDFALRNGLTKLNCFSGSYMGPNECRKPSRCLEAIERLDSIVLSRGSSSSVKEMEDWINRASQNRNCAIAIGSGSLVSNVRRAYEAIQDSAVITSLPSVVIIRSVPSTAYFNYGGAVRWYRRSAGGYCGITSPTHLKVLQTTDPAPSLGDRSPSEFGSDLGVCPPYAFYFNYGGAVRHFSSNRGGYCAFTSPDHLNRFQQSNPAISLGNQTPRRDFGRDTGVCP